jgi:hypothetical protein
LVLCPANGIKSLPRGMMEALVVTASICAENGRLFATIGPCLSVGSNWLLWLAGKRVGHRNLILADCLLAQCAIAVLPERSPVRLTIALPERLPGGLTQDIGVSNHVRCLAGGILQFEDGHWHSIREHYHIVPAFPVAAHGHADHGELVHRQPVVLLRIGKVRQPDPVAPGLAVLLPKDLHTPLEPPLKLLIARPQAGRACTRQNGDPKGRSPGSAGVAVEL